MNCPSCGAALNLDGDPNDFVCNYCKSLYYPEKNDDGVRVLGEPSKHACPVCAVPLMQAIVGFERIEYCQRCRGMLIAMENFLLVIEEMKAEIEGRAARHAPDPRELERHIGCPSCHRTMDTHHYAGPGNVVIDSCSRCFLNWLDHGELRRIVQAPERTYGDAHGPIVDPFVGNR
jgi:Zn-finger nucleic acid-binding protein